MLFAYVTKGVQADFAYSTTLLQVFVASEASHFAFFLQSPQIGKSRFQRMFHVFGVLSMGCGVLHFAANFLKKSVVTARPPLPFGDHMGSMLSSSGTRWHPLAAPWVAWVALWRWIW